MEWDPGNGTWETGEEDLGNRGTGPGERDTGNGGTGPGEAGNETAVTGPREQDPGNGEKTGEQKPGRGDLGKESNEYCLLKNYQIIEIQK